MTEDNIKTTILTDRQTDRPLLVLELFAGTRSISKAFERRGHKTFCVEWNKEFNDIDLYKDIRELTTDEILEKFGRPDVIWASPECTTYSLAAISKHRRKNPITGNLDPISDYAKFCDDVNQHVLNLIKELNPKLYFIENPRGGLCNMNFMKGIPKHLATYCFKGDTRFITKDGIKTFKETEGDFVKILNINGEWENAIIRRYGKDELYKVILSRARKKKIIYTTANHIWIAANPTGNHNGYKNIATKDLQKGMLLPYSICKRDFELNIIPEYVCRGFVFGDGHVLKNKQSNGSYATLYGDKQELLHYFDGFGGKRWNGHCGKIRYTQMCSLPYYWKNTTPSVNDNPSNIYSWIAGYIASDGCCSASNGQVTISSSKKENLEAVKELAEVIGIGTYSINEYYRKGFKEEKTPLYQMTFMRSDITEDILLRSKHKQNFNKNKNIKFQPRRWSVVSVEPTGVIDDVYCCETTDTHTFTLEDGIVTHNCQYGYPYMKPTHIFTNHPNPQFKHCKNGDPCHERAPRGSKSGLQKIKKVSDRSTIPPLLCDHIVDISEEYILGKSPTKNQK